MMSTSNFGDQARIKVGTDFNSTARGPSDAESFASRLTSFVRTSWVDKQAIGKHRDWLKPRANE
jgi:hypothetical protein